MWFFWALLGAFFSSISVTFNKRVLNKEVSPTVVSFFLFAITTLFSLPLYLARMIEAGQDPLYIARRMVIFASEDVGMAQPTALVVANEVFRACEVIGYPECAINLAHGVVYLASAKKDRSSYDGLQKAMADVRKYGNLPIPKNILNAPTKLMKEMGYGKGYKKYDDESYLPETLKGKKYY